MYICICSSGSAAEGHIRYYTYAYTYVYMCIYICIYMRLDQLQSVKFVTVYAYICIYIYVYIYIYICVWISCRGSLSLLLCV